MLNKLKVYLPRKIKKVLLSVANLFFDQFKTYCYSQEGEDIVLKRVFGAKENGFYVDVGAHHPKRFSNTYIFYKQGWQGINIEPNPEMFELFKKHRSRDINLNCGIGQNSTSLNYYMFDEPALNTFESEVLKSRLTETSYKHNKTLIVEVKTLAQVLSQYVSFGKIIDFLTVDVEGFDLEVLKSNDWFSFRPKWVLVEQLNLTDIESLDFEIHRYMNSVGYVLFGKTFNTLFYRDKKV
jgi:FkbM family methyltransferase